MSKKEKLIKKLKAGAGSFTFDEAMALLGALGYVMTNKGKTSGSRVSFANTETGAKIIMHKPHPQKELKEYQVRQLREHLEEEGLL